MTPRMQGFVRGAGIGLLVLTLAGCSAHASRRDNTVIGAGIGAIAAATFTEGDPALTLGGAAVGALLGNALTDSRRYDRSRSYRSYRASPPPRYRPPRRAWR